MVGRAPPESFQGLTGPKPAGMPGGRGGFLVKSACFEIERLAIKNKRHPGMSALERSPCRFRPAPQVAVCLVVCAGMFVRLNPWGTEEGPGQHPFNLTWQDPSDFKKVTEEQ